LIWATLYRAVLEGLAFEARLTVDDLRALPGLRPIEQIRAIGATPETGSCCGSRRRSTAGRLPAPRCRVETQAQLSFFFV
jgi:hypothetical protein